MRLTKSNAEISVKVIAGLEVVLFGLNIPEADKDRLLGFKIQKKVGNGYILLSDGRKFANSQDSIIQDFLWGDYSVDPNTTYTYKINAVYGTPNNTEESETIQLQVTTENPKDHEHAVFFNRGVAGSQAYSKKFKKYRKWYKTEALEEDSSKIRYKQFIKPEDVPNGEAYKWLSRGLEEALIDFIGKAKDKSYSIRASLYELSYVPAAQAFVDALERGVDVKIIHHAKRKTSYKMSRNSNAKTTINYTDGTKDLTFSGELKKLRVPEGITTTAMKTIAKVGVTDPKHWRAFSKMLIQRTNTTISHNKFILLLKDGKPVELWTGSTNITYGGIFGQSNIGHIVRDEAIAQKYLEYWNKLSEDPIKTKRGSDPNLTAMKNWIAENNPNLDDIPPNSIHAIFSPRKDLDMLQWYADQINKAKESVFFTAAFSMDDKLLNVLKNNSASAQGAFQRYLLLEGITGLMRDKYPLLRQSGQNRIAYGAQLKRRKGIEHTDVAIETLTGLNDHVNYIHTKYLLVDALSDDPVVISGSANFSEASTKDNDENMLIIRGNTRIADMFICDFMRLFNHFKRRNDSNKLTDAQYLAHDHLDPGSQWVVPYFTADDQLEQQRLLFGTDVV
ncbi:phospholipase D-like domain-containing protein [Aureisphaera galaxeae]|uniref:phospholipase D-like domain-containing protein n=1 Tax=Aureisphaera galaxeae TaxID=1538023 RepID=UPI0023504E31|nr:phospholipase D-like domain-containing protein [Aureisphaera galaxeae]MDC8004300.1 phospholipase D-like domain-containing protein [Aureisphaera galaxeae]